MNIFVTDLDAKIAAQNLDDKRVRHMPKECIEMLGIYLHSTLGHWIIPFPIWGNDERDEPNFLYNHPCSKWVRKDKAHVSWLLKHTIALIDECEYRGLEIPACGSFLSAIIPLIPITDQEPEIFQNSSHHKNKTIVAAYRETMITKWTVTDKIKPVRFTKRGAPAWFAKQLAL